jgi:hypothetical protein
MAIILAAGIEPIDIWLAAQLIVAQHGELAVIECAMKAGEMLDRGDVDGQAVWMAIRRAARFLLEKGPPPDVSAASPH